MKIQSHMDNHRNILAKQFTHNQKPSYNLLVYTAQKTASSEKKEKYISIC